MATANILLLESERTSTPDFRAALEKRGYTVLVEHTSRATLKATRTVEPDLVVLDAASLKTSGTRICRQLRATLDGTPILLIVDKKNQPDPTNGATVTLQLPFTSRKLVNSVSRLLPGDESGYVQVGPIKLNLAQKRIVSGGKEKRVTPKQARLMEMFVRAPGQLLTRKEIIKHVWDTDYTGDTRTLDVHMSWLRSVLEPNPRHPRYLKTVRGQGYILDLSVWSK